MKPTSEINPVVVFTGTAWQAGMVKTLLEDAGIEAFVLEHARATYNPGWNLPGEEGSVRVMISDLDLEEARPIVEEYVKNIGN
ncbi:MAG: DUF2007 domain-containing protein [Prolixibacteraceae bacterium]|jgi:hypothetical protein|nr:DUF2007 domain-containing protein [Prolixibacteraceae bacterium]